MTTKPALTVREAAEKLGCSPSGLRLAADMGRVPGAYKHGRDWVLPVPVQLLDGKGQVAKEWP